MLCSPHMLSQLLHHLSRQKAYIHAFTLVKRPNPLHHEAVCMQVYLPMSYMYGVRGTCKPTPLTAALREELFTQAYSSIDWNAARSQCAKEDLYYPRPAVQVGVCHRR